MFGAGAADSDGIDAQIRDVSLRWLGGRPC